MIATTVGTTITGTIAKTAPTGVYLVETAQEFIVSTNRQHHGVQRQYWELAQTVHPDRD